MQSFAHLRRRKRHVKGVPAQFGDVWPFVIIGCGQKHFDFKVTDQVNQSKRLHLAQGLPQNQQFWPLSIGQGCDSLHYVAAQDDAGIRPSFHHGLRQIKADKPVGVLNQDCFRHAAPFEKEGGVMEPKAAVRT